MDAETGMSPQKIAENSADQVVHPFWISQQGALQQLGDVAWVLLHTQETDKEGMESWRDDKLVIKSG